jgi:hypothetical protein
MSQWSIGAGVRQQAYCLKESLVTYEAMQIHVDSVISIGQQECAGRSARDKESRREASRLSAVRVWRLVAGMSSQHVQIML